MRVSAEQLAAAAEATGFRADMLERVAQLLGLLDAMQRHPFLRGKLALKGGTALNLFVFDLPRLSVDIDLNYVGAESRETMLEERPRLEEALRAVFGREDLTGCAHRSQGDPVIGWMVIHPGAAPSMFGGGGRERWGRGCFEWRKSMYSGTRCWSRARAGAGWHARWVSAATRCGAT